jgi:hypothetical protein
MNLVLDSHGGITGSGILHAVIDTTACAVMFPVSGSKR